MDSDDSHSTMQIEPRSRAATFDSGAHYYQAKKKSSAGSSLRNSQSYDSKTAHHPEAKPLKGILKTSNNHPSHTRESSRQTVESSWYAGSTYDQSRPESVYDSDREDESQHHGDDEGRDVGDDSGSDIVIMTNTKKPKPKAPSPTVRRAPSPDAVERPETADSDGSSMIIQPNTQKPKKAPEPPKETPRERQDQEEKEEPPAEKAKPLDSYSEYVEIPPKAQKRESEGKNSHSRAVSKVSTRSKRSVRPISEKSNSSMFRPWTRQAAQNDIAEGWNPSTKIERRDDMPLSIFRESNGLPQIKPSKIPVFNRPCPVHSQMPKYCPVHGHMHTHAGKSRAHSHNPNEGRPITTKKLPPINDGPTKLREKFSTKNPPTREYGRHPIFDDDDDVDTERQSRLRPSVDDNLPNFHNSHHIKKAPNPNVAPKPAPIHTTFTGTQFKTTRTPPVQMQTLNQYHQKHLQQRKPPAKLPSDASFTAKYKEPLRSISPKPAAPKYHETPHNHFSPLSVHPHSHMQAPSPYFPPPYFQYPNMRPPSVNSHSPHPSQPSPQMYMPYPYYYSMPPMPSAGYGGYGMSPYGALPPMQQGYPPHPMVYQKQGSRNSMVFQGMPPPHQGHPMMPHQDSQQPIVGHDGSFHQQ